LHSPPICKPRKTTKTGCPSAVTKRSGTARLISQKLEIICSVQFVRTVTITNILPIVPMNVDKTLTTNIPYNCARGKRQHTMVALLSWVAILQHACNECIYLLRFPHLACWPIKMDLTWKKEKKKKNGPNLSAENHLDWLAFIRNLFD